MFVQHGVGTNDSELGHQFVEQIVYYTEFFAFYFALTFNKCCYCYLLTWLSYGILCTTCISFSLYSQPKYNINFVKVCKGRGSMVKFT